MLFIDFHWNEFSKKVLIKICNKKFDLKKSVPGGRGKDTVQKGSNVTDVILQSGHRTVLWVGYSVKLCRHKRRTENEDDGHPRTMAFRLTLNWPWKKSVMIESFLARWASQASTATVSSGLPWLSGNSIYGLLITLFWSSCNASSNVEINSWESFWLYPENWLLI